MLHPPDVPQRPAQLSYGLITQPFKTPASDHCVTLPTQLGIKAGYFGLSSFSIAFAPASTTAPPPQVFTSPLPAAPGYSIPRRDDFVP